jgi:hypothetical protein
MDREHAKDMLPIIKAFVDGKEIEFKSDIAGWVSLPSLQFIHAPDRYRIKPEKRKVDVWLNVYAKNPQCVHASRAEADASRGPGRIACLHIIQEYEEGEGL